MTTPPDRLAAAATALLVLDFQEGILAALPDDAEPDALVARVARAAAGVRAHGGTVAYVGVGFTEADWAAVPAANKAFSAAARHRAMHHADPSTRFPAALVPEPEDITLRKTRFGAFSTTDLDRRLRARGIGDLIVAGVSTSGVVLSTVTDAADRDYRLRILSDGVADPDPDVHRVLMTGVFPRMADIVETAGLAGLLGTNENAG
jgi:nicotinamidase-related amidase